MPHARIINTEFKSKEDLEIAIIAWKKWYPDNMPVSLSRYIVRTGDKSTMMTLHVSHRIPTIQRPRISL